MNTSSSSPASLATVPPKVPVAQVRVAPPLVDTAPGQWPWQDWPSWPVEIPEGRQCFKVDWSAPAGSEMAIDGWDGNVSPRASHGNLTKPFPTCERVCRFGIAKTPWTNTRKGMVSLHPSGPATEHLAATGSGT